MGKKEDVQHDRMVHAIDRLIDVLDLKAHNMRQLSTHLYNNDKSHEGGIEWEKANLLIYTVIPSLEKLKEKA